MKKEIIAALSLALSSFAFAQGISVGTRITMTQKLQLNSGAGQFAQVFVPDYFRAPSDSALTLIFHLHGASWAAEDEVYKARMNAIVFNIHLGSFSSSYQNYFVDQSKFQLILDSILSVIHSRAIVPQPRIQYLILTSFSAGYAGVREVFKNSSYYARTNALTLADGLHCSSDSAARVTQMQDFLRLATDSRERRKIMCLTHSNIATSGYDNTTQTADYLISGIRSTRVAVNITDSIGLMYSRCDTGYFHVREYRGTTAGDHLRHLYNMHLMLQQVMSILNILPTSIEEDREGNHEESFRLFQNWPNPFNSTTTMRFSFVDLHGEGGRGFVSLKVFDVLGREVATLVNEVKLPGRYTVSWNAHGGPRQNGVGGLASGVYFVRLSAGALTQTRKVVLMK
jgi:hypothetical protein